MDSTKDRIYTLLSIVFILILTFIVYYQLFNHDFLLIDDSVYVYNNQYVKSGLNLNNIYWAFTSFKAEFWHPVTWLSYMLDTQIYGVIPGGYLLTNLIIHLINVFLIFLFFKLATNKLWESVVIAVLFGLHPLHVETVAWIAERKELLCSFFWLLTLVCYYYYTKYPDWKRYCLVVICFILGIMSKTMIVTLPFTLLLLDYWPLNRTASLKKLILEKILLFVLSIVGIAITLFAQHKGGGLVSLDQYSIVQRLSNSIVSYALYIYKTIWPVNLSVFYPVKDIAPFIIVSSILFLIILTIIFIIVFKKQKFFMTGWLWFLGTLVPVIGIVKIGDFAMADRYMYIPIIGLFIILAFGLNMLLSRASHRLMGQWVVLIIIIACYTPNTYYQIGTWKNSEALFKHSLNTDPDNFLAYHSMGELSAGKGDMHNAAFYFAKAVKIRPEKSSLWIKLGRALYADNLKAQAIEIFQKAQILSKHHPATHFYLLCSLLDMGNIIEAQKQLILMFENDSTIAKTKDYLSFKKYFYKKQFPETNIFFNKVLNEIGIINKNNNLSHLIIQSHSAWKLRYLNKADHENNNSNIN